MNRPKVKDAHGVMYLQESIRIGTVQTLAFEIPDSDGRYTALIKLLDGKHSVEDITKELSSILTQEEILEGLELLYQEGVIENAAILPPDELSEDELNRYRVNLNFFSTLTRNDESKYEYQMMLKKSHVLVFGIGGIGSNVCLALAELGVGKITAVDFDRVELSNLNRQVLYSATAVGRLKTDVATERIQEFNPEIQFKAINKRVSSLDDVREILFQTDCDVVINLADKPTGSIDFWVNQACCEKQVPYFAAMVPKHLGRIYSVFPGETACYNCMFTQEVERSGNILTEIEAIRETEFWAPNGALGPACMFHAYFLSYEVLRHLLNIGPVLTKNRLYEIDFVTFENEFHPFEKRDDCPICSKVGVHTV